MNIIKCDGVSFDVMGGYLTGAGVLSVLSRKYPETRVCWQEDRLVVMTNATREEVIDYLLTGYEPIPYDGWWLELQKKDTAAGKADNIRFARSNEKSLDRVMTLDAHIACRPGSGRFNSVLGKGGTFGKRNIMTGWAESLKRIKDPESRRWLEHTLFGGNVELPHLHPGVGSWFASASKNFNSGQNREGSDEGVLSPWSYILSVEGAVLLTGSIGSRTWSRSRYPRFPFMSRPPTPKDKPTPKKKNPVDSEFWAPVWSRPATISEVRTLLRRGMSRNERRNSCMPYEFATSALSLGVDAGIIEFIRFSFQCTTSKNTFEAIPKQRILVTCNPRSIRDGLLLAELAPWLHRVDHPLKYHIEELVIEVAENPDDPQRWQRLLLDISTVVVDMDRNKNKRNVRSPIFTSEWFERAWPSVPPEIAIARAVSMIGSGGSFPLRYNIIGRDDNARRSVVWRGGVVDDVFITIISRRLIDGSTMCSPVTVDAEHVTDFIDGALDDRKIMQWIPPLSLIEGKERFFSGKETSTADYLFAGYLRPLVSDSEKGSATIVNLLSNGQWKDAVRIASARYRAELGKYGSIGEPVIGPSRIKRVAASLLIPVHDNVVMNALKRFEVCKR